MAKIKTGRNGPGPCGSGQKYKRCCLEKGQHAASAALAEAAAARLAASYHRHDHAHCDSCGGVLDDSDDLACASNAIIDMIDDGRLDEAELAARDLVAHSSDVHDGYHRLGMVYVARGDKEQAAHYYRQVADFVGAHTDQYEPEIETRILRLIEKPDPTPTD